MHPPQPSQRPSAGFAWLTALFCCLISGVGCNIVDAATSRGATLIRMMPGRNAETGSLDCWLTIEFRSYPEEADARDVRVRFYSDALSEPAEFDWDFIAANDVLADRTKLRGGHRESDRTRPAANPPLGEALKVRFPLDALPTIEQAASPVWLQAELYWGGEIQDSLRRSIEHVYSGTEAT